MKLFMVQVEYTRVIQADNQDDAERRAFDHGVVPLTQYDPDTNVFACEITEMKNTHYLYDSLPFNGDGTKTVGELLEEA